MVAPKNNKFWEARSSHGRKPCFETAEDLLNACNEYFEWVHENPLKEAIVYQGQLNEAQAKPLMRAMTLQGLSIFLGISDQTWLNYRKRGDDYAEVADYVDRVIRTQKFEGAAAGLFNPVIISRDLGLKDLTASEITGKDGEAIEVNDTSRRDLARRIAFLLNSGALED